MYKLNTNISTRKSWRDQLAEVKNAKQRFSDYYSIMTQLERLTAQTEISNMQRAYNKNITAGILGEHEDALQKLNRAHNKVLSERRNEINSWDAVRLNSEMQIYDMLIKQAIKTESGASDWRKDTGDRIKEIIKEADQSGDRYKQRAALEILKAATKEVKGLEAQREMNLIAQESKGKLEKVRSTPAFEKAVAEAETVWSEYKNKRQELIRTSQDIGEGDPTDPLMHSVFSHAIKRVQVIDNEIKIFDPDAPEVTGVIKKNQGG